MLERESISERNGLILCWQTYEKLSFMKYVYFINFEVRWYVGINYFQNEEDL